MFLAASSADNRDITEVEDFASVFSTSLQEPIELQNFTIELVSAIITSEKNLKISEINSKFVIRMGDSIVAEQYLVKIPSDTYTPDEFATIIVEKILEVIPVQGWVQNSAGAKSFSAVYDTSLTPALLKLTFTKLAVNDDVINTLLTDRNAESYAQDLNIASGAGNIVDVNFKYKQEQERNNEPLYSSTNFNSLPIGGSTRGLDVASSITTSGGDPSAKTQSVNYAGFDNVGIAEQGGIYELEISTQRCSIDTNYNKNIGAGAVNTAPYFVIEDNTENTIYDSFTFDRALLNPRSRTTIRNDSNNQRYVSGILLAQEPTAANAIFQATQGAPYMAPKAVLCFPPNDSGGIDAAGDLTSHRYRQERIKSTWNNSFRMFKKINDGAEINSFNHFENRGFNLEIDEGTLTNPNSLAKSSLALLKNLFEDELEEKEPLNIRLANAPLIQGLPKTDANGNILQSFIDTTNIMTAGTTAAGLTLTYKLNVVGQMNRGFGRNDPTGQPTGLPNGSGGITNRLPYYKVTKIDATTGQPEKVVLVDSGEEILVGERMYLNDPATFEITANTNGLTDLQIMDSHIAFVIPTAATIGACVDTYTTRFQFLPTTISLTNDLIYSAANAFAKDAFVQTNNRKYSANFAKDLEFSIIPMDSTGLGTGGANETVRFEVRGFEPTQTTFNTEGELYDAFKTNPENTSDMFQLYYNGNPGSWNSNVTYTPARSAGTQPPNWTNFSQNNAAAKIKLTLELNNYFEFSCKVNYLDLTAGPPAYNPAQQATLLNTFEKASTAVPAKTFDEFLCCNKTRLYPYHLGISSPIGTNYVSAASQGDNVMRFTGCKLAKYTRGINPITKSRFESFYEQNQFNMVKGQDNEPDIFTFPGNQTALGGPDLSRPPIMLKFGNDITAGTPTAGTAVANILEPEDIPPTPFSFLSNVTGFNSSYICDTGAFGAGTAITFAAVAGVTDIPVVGTFVVELENMPAKGYITTGFTAQNIQKGNGASLPIVGVVPFLEQRDASPGETYLTLRYSTPYSQPVLVKLPTTQFIYNFNFKLRNVENNKYLRHLLNPTELIFRIQPL